VSVNPGDVGDLSYFDFSQVNMRPFQTGAMVAAKI
jgi:hypothetical protein